MFLQDFSEKYSYVKMGKELLIKFLNNQCTESELSEVLRWVNSDTLKDEFKKLSFEDWKNYKELNILDEDVKFTAIFDEIQKRIDTKNVKTNKSLSLTIVVNWITKVAAILLIPVLSILVYTISENKIELNKYANLALDSLEVIAPVGSRTVVQLSDGSKVQLNYGSKIKYPHFFSDKNREVTLSGEGFFEVAHNLDKPFIVKAGNLEIKAVGTSFNVFAYPNRDVIETTLVTGKVILKQIITDKKNKTIGSMAPGQHVNYNIQTGTLSSTKGNYEKYISWIEGKLIFEDTPIFQVTERLSRMFNVDFEVKDEIKYLTYTVIFSDESLSQILDLMTIATPVVCEILPRKKLPDGTFSKQKIILKKR